MPLSAPAVNLAGEPSRFGGCLAKAAGWLVLAGGLSLALFLGLLLSWLSPESAAAWVASLPVAVLTLSLGGLLLFGGKRLDESGRNAKQTTREHALTSLASTTGGWVSARRAAHSLQISADEADALLTAMAKRRPDDVTVELDDRGEIKYRFTAYARDVGPRVRFDVDDVPRGGRRIADVDEEADAEADAIAGEARGPGAARRRTR